MNPEDPSNKHWARMARHTRTQRPVSARLASTHTIRAHRNSSTHWILENFELLLSVQYLGALKITPTIPWKRLIKLGFPTPISNKIIYERMSQSFWQRFLNLYDAQSLPTHNQMLAYIDTVLFLSNCISPHLSHPVFNNPNTPTTAANAPPLLNPPSTNATPQPTPRAHMHQQPTSPRTIDDITEDAPPRPDPPQSEIETYPQDIQDLYHRSKEQNND